MMVERAYYACCRGLGKLLRGGKYSTVRIVDRHGARQVRKRRLFYAPLLIRLGGPLVRILDTGSRVLSQREWEDRERLLYERLYGSSIRVAAGGTLILPELPGQPLATLLEDPALGDPARTTAVGLAVVALAGLHARGFTHADAMAENVMVDLDARVARWFDFETAHDPSRPMVWRRADDVRALLATCLVRARPGRFDEMLQLILDTYADDAVTRLLLQNVVSVWQRPLTFHLGQAPLPFRRFREFGLLLRARLDK